jgi:hypothetical protein
MIELTVFKRGTDEVTAMALVDDDQVMLACYKWTLDKKGYVMRKAAGKRIYLHSVVAGPRPNGLVTDHINRNKLDNRSSNLRFVNHAESMANRNPYGASSYAGVCIDRTNQHWKGSYRLNGKTRHVGNFASEVDAAQAVVLDKFLSGVGGHAISRLFGL